MDDATWERDEWWDRYCEPDTAGQDEAADDAGPTCSYCRGAGCDLCVDDAIHAKSFGHTPDADLRWQQRQRARYGRDYSEYRGGDHAA